MDKQFGLDSLNSTCIDGVAATVLSLLGVPKEDGMQSPIQTVLDKATEKFSHNKQNSAENAETKTGDSICDRVFMYNPDAIAQWIYGKYYDKILSKAESQADLVVPMLSVFPPVTPVCFGSMYSGLQPEKHGIQSYEKPVLKCPTIFDSLISHGKKVAIVSTKNDSISLIFLERNMDYFIYKTVKECNQKASELIKEDKYDCIVLYNTDYDYWMHRNSPTGPLAVKALKQDVSEFCSLKKQIADHWQSKHRTALAFAPDHGCHYWYGILGQHGKNEPCDMNIMHLWSFI